MSWAILWAPPPVTRGELLRNERVDRLDGPWAEDRHGPFATRDEAEAHAEVAAIPMGWPYRLEEVELG